MSVITIKRIKSTKYLLMGFVVRMGDLATAVIRNVADSQEIIEPPTHKSSDLLLAVDL